MEAKTYYKVHLIGDVIIEAVDEADAIVKASALFTSAGTGLAWAIEKVVVQINVVP